MAKLSKRNPAAGQSIIETVVGIMFVVPIVLFLLDVGVIVLVNSANDSLAKTVARAAASGTNLATGSGSASAGYTAAQVAANTFAESGLVVKPSGGSFLTGYCWNGLGTPSTQSSTWPATLPEPVAGNVGVVTTITMNLPVPFPFLPNSINFQASDVEPVVSVVPTSSLSTTGGAGAGATSGSGAGAGGSGSRSGSGSGAGGAGSHSGSGSTGAGTGTLGGPIAAGMGAGSHSGSGSTGAGTGTLGGPVAAGMGAGGKSGEGLGGTGAASHGQDSSGGNASSSGGFGSGGATPAAGAVSASPPPSSP